MCLSSWFIFACSFVHVCLSVCLLKWFSICSSCFSTFLVNLFKCLAFALCNCREHCSRILFHSFKSSSSAPIVTHGVCTVRPLGYTRLSEHSSLNLL